MAEKMAMLARSFDRIWSQILLLLTELVLLGAEWLISNIIPWRYVLEYLVSEAFNY